MNLNRINVTHPAILRAAGHHQTTSGLLYAPPPIVVGGPNGGTTITRKGFTVVRYDIQNHSGGAANIGYGFRFRNAIWQMGRLSADGATYTDLTSSAQSTGTTTLQVVGANQTGFAIGCLRPIWWATVNITTAETDDDAGVSQTPDHAVQYSQGASWSSAVSVAMTDDFTLTNTVWTAAVKNFVWAPPTDWTVSAALGGVPNGYYWLRFTSAHREANDVAAVATGIECGSGYFRWQIGNNVILAAEKVQDYEPDADGLVAYFSTANAGNLVYAEVLS